MCVRVSACESLEKTTTGGLHACVLVHVCVRTCVCVSVRAWMRVRVRACECL